VCYYLEAAVQARALPDLELLTRIVAALEKLKGGESEEP
jgi:hypothetical protein